MKIEYLNKTFILAYWRLCVYWCEVQQRVFIFRWWHLWFNESAWKTVSLLQLTHAIQVYQRPFTLLTFWSNENWYSNSHLNICNSSAIVTNWSLCLLLVFMDHWCFQAILSFFLSFFLSYLLILKYNCSPSKPNIMALSPNTCQTYWVNY